MNSLKLLLGVFFGSTVFDFVFCLDGRIVGGQIVDINNYPYQVSLRIYDQHICGGTILNERVILTAAHCVYGSNKEALSIRVGHSVHYKGLSYKISKYIYHKNYNNISIDNDVALLKLSKKLKYLKTVKPIALQNSGVEVPVGTVAYVSGWGIIDHNLPFLSNNLQAVDIKIVSIKYCNNSYAGRITKSMLCAHTIGHDSCQGDSGGPLVANNKIIGIVSWGIDCGRFFPGVYTNVSFFNEWISNNTKLLSGASRNTSLSIVIIQIFVFTFYNYIYSN